MNVAVTGSIASGKSVFVRILVSSHPFAVFDADICVRDLLAANNLVKREIRTSLGDDVFDSDGRIDRRLLREKAFACKTSRSKLEEILHPEVRKRWLKMLDGNAAAGRDFLAEIPLLFEVGAEKYFDATILIAASEPVQRIRITERGLPESTANAIIARQWPVADKVQRATTVVWNDGSISQLEQQAALILERLKLSAQ